MSCFCVLLLCAWQGQCSTQQLYWQQFYWLTTCNTIQWYQARMQSEYCMYMATHGYTWLHMATEYTDGVPSKPEGQARRM